MTWYELLTSNDTELRRQGVEDPSWVRQATTGHRRAMTPGWVRAVGSWGGVATLRQIAEVTEREFLEVRDYARAMGLRARTRNLARTPAQLAVLAYASTESATIAARTLGCLPVEVALGRCAVQTLLDLHGLRFGELIACEPADVEAWWAEAELDLRLRPPPATMHGETWRERMRRVVAAVETDIGGS